MNVGTIQFHVTSGVISDGIADVSGCYECVPLPPPNSVIGDGPTGTGSDWPSNALDATFTTFNGIEIVPEPTPATLLALGLVGIAAARRRTAACAH